MSAPERPWYELAFGTRYDEVYAHRDDASAAIEVAWLADVLSVQPTDTLLDVGCGNGRHLSAWSERRISSLGIDLSPELIAKAHARRLPGVCVLRGDMRSLGIRDHFDVVTSLFTSFGYFSEDDDRRVVRGWADALRPGGRLAMDYLNVHAIRANLVPHSTRTVDGRLIEEHRRIDEERTRVEKDVLIREADSTETRYRESVRLYSRDDLEALLDDHGLRVEAAYGTLDGEPFAEASPRLVLIARRERSAS